VGCHKIPLLVDKTEEHQSQNLLPNSPKLENDFKDLLKKIKIKRNIKKIGQTIMQE